MKFLALVAIGFQTPALWISLWPAFLSSPYWFLVGLAGLASRWYFSIYIYLSHSARNAGNAVAFIAKLRDEGYEGSLSKLSDVLPSVAENHESSCTIYVKVAKPRSGLRPLNRYFAYSMPAHRVAIAFVGEEPKKLGDVLYFQFLHEIGHALFSGQSHTLNRVAPLQEVFVLYLPIAMLCSWWPFQIAIAALAFWHYRIERTPDYAEVSADQFAIKAFDETRGRESRERAVEYLVAQWRDSDDEEKRLRSSYLMQPLGYKPDIKKVRSADFFRYFRRSEEVATDETAWHVTQRVINGPVTVAALLVVAYHSSFRSLVGAAPTEALFVSFSSLVLLAVFAFFATLLAEREVMRQSYSVARILAASEYRSSPDKLGRSTVDKQLE